MYTYKDFMTGKPKKTRGKFQGWTKGGPLNAWYAIFHNRASDLLVPHYCLTIDTINRLPLPPDGE